MLIGKRGAATTAISAARSDRITVRGRDLASDLMGKLSFSEFFFLVATGRSPTVDQCFFLDLSLIAIAEHGLTPSVQAARMTYAADPAALQGAIAAGVLGCGTVILGAADLCQRLLEELFALSKQEASLEEAASHLARDYRASGRPIPGFGHPLHKPLDPRAERMLTLARERGIAGLSIEGATCLAKAVAEVWGKPLPMNVSMAIAAVMRDLDVPSARDPRHPGFWLSTAGLHRPSGRRSRDPDRFLARFGRRGSHPAHGRSSLMNMFEPEIESAPWDQQAGRDEPIYRAQLDHLFESSRFYKDKFQSAGIRTSREIGGLEAIANLPFTDKDELRQSRSEAEPIGAHRTAPFEQIVRIYSTSGTTGTPSYIPLTPSDLDAWVRTSARSYAASGVARGERVVSTYNAGPFVAGAALGAFDRLGLCHIPVGTGHTERLIAAIKLLEPNAAVLTPSYALHLSEWAHQRGFDLANSSVTRVMVAGEPGGGEPAMRAKLESAWGATVTEAMGIGDISVSLWGECEAKGGMHFSGRGFVHFELIDPSTGAPIPFVSEAEGRARAHPSP